MASSGPASTDFISYILYRLSSVGFTVTRDHASNRFRANDATDGAFLENVPMGEDTGLKGAFLIFSNIPMLLVVFAAILKANNTKSRNQRTAYLFCATLFFFGMIISTFYHTCQSIGVCIGQSFHTWQLSDHSTANLCIVAIILIIISDDDPIFYAVAGVGYIVLSVLFVIADPVSVRSSIQIITVGAALAFVKYALVDQGRFESFEQRFSVKWATAGAIFGTLGSAFYIFDAGPSYYWAHGSWHVASAIAELCLFMAFTADVSVFACCSPQNRVTRGHTRTL